MQGNKKLANHKNFGGARNAVRFIVVHYTANKGDTAKNNADYFAREKVGASAHFFVDETEVWGKRACDGMCMALRGENLPPF